MSVMFTPEQLIQLQSKLDPAHVKPRRGADGREVSYLEGWHVIDEANRIFGFGNWECETIDMREVHPPVMFTPPPTRERPNPKEQVVACYAAKARITIWDEAHTKKCIREGWSAHRSFNATVGEAVENAIKGAETDAMKRALRSFGNAFGLALYDKSHKNVGREDRRWQLAQSHERPMAPLEEGFDGEPPALGEGRGSRPTTSQRALAVTGKPMDAAQPNGAMRY